MKFLDEAIRGFLKHHYQVEAQVSTLPGELDLNYFVQSVDGHSYILKVANRNEQRANLELQNAVIDHLSNQSLGLQVSRVVKSIDGKEILEIEEENEKPRMVRLLTWVEGRVFAKVQPQTPVLFERLGELCGKLCQSLSNFDHPSAHRFMKWDLAQALWIKPHLNKFRGEKSELVNYFYHLFEENVIPILPKLRQSVIYNDANDYNVLVTHDKKDPHVAGVIDFGDVVFTHTINELAIAIAYAILNKPDPLETACQVVAGHNKAFKILEEELALIFPLVTARLLISVTVSELNRLEHPDNVYLQISSNDAWEALAKLKNISPNLFHFAFRNVCGVTPCAKENVFTLWAELNHSKVSFPITRKETISWLDLSVGSLEMGTMQNVLDAKRFDQKVNQLMNEASTALALGRYNEARAIYTTDTFAAEGNDAPVWRTIHIGLDFFTQQGTEVHAVLDGVIHSFANNKGDRDYGPTIILEHKVTDDLTFYTLYGHLSTHSIASLKVGQVIKGGEIIGRIGSLQENGNWPPHLHFQVILDMLDHQGDFPGVAYASQIEVWKSISPDQWLLLTGKLSEQNSPMPKEEIVAYRKEHLGKNMSISYKDPIKMVRGYGAYLLDDTGRRYLDTVNNVAHVGHEHPRVVAAGQQQMAVLNTNTRYLHENLVKFVQELLTTMPPQLNVAFLVNSGSEANELALRLAKNFTAQKDMIVSEVGYHGNTNGCVEISSYKFDGPGGKGATPHIHVVPIPDVYRGLYRASDSNAGSSYASHVQEAIRRMEAQGRKPAALIFESVISCGGQVELPKNFLSEAYRYVRAAGGVCIADEVQTACGRAGDTYWAFEAHEVVPDIVTIGKPIGNGHPLGVVVTTQAIADAFKNGMEYFNTFGGNPVSCAIGLEVLKVIKEEKLQENARVVGNYLKSGLNDLMRQFEIIGDVRGPGLFIGFELVKDRETKTPATDQASYFANRMRDKGILMSTDGPFNNVLKIKPPVVFSKPNADFLLDSIAKVLKEDFMMPDK
jgi:4-aminobutyrate aminotransferase-like enzyme/Ser/Thr protein kinase RdoA (MazF antagonist)